VSWLVANTVVAAGVALLALLAARCKAAPTVVHALWVFVLLKLVTPPLFAVPVELPWRRAETAPPAVVVPMRLDDAFVLPPAVALRDVLEAAEPATVRAVDPLVEQGAQQHAWQRAAFAVWAAGACALLLWLLVGVVRGHRRLRALGPVPPSVRREIETLAARLGVRVPELRDDPAAGSPYVWSLGRTCLVVPVRTLASASTKGRAAVLAHELAHLRRGDHWVAHAELLLALALWWHPLFWLARARMRLWAELACDAWAVACVPDATIDYATVLVQAVAAPDSAVPAPAVLAARPAARAAFERRLTMILNENVACRASRAWWLPFSSLALALFTVPVAAQRAPQEPAKVEIRVNGKSVDELSPAERKALLEKLLAAEERAGARADGKQEPATNDKPAKKKARPKTDADPTVETHVVPHVEVLPPKVEVRDTMPSAKELREMIRSGLADARVEILHDADLRELGITDEMTKLLEDLEAGRGVGENVDLIVRGAMKGASKKVKKELAADKDLRDLGLHDSISQLVDELLQSSRMQAMIADAARSAAESALHTELRRNPELRRLGIEDDTKQLIDSLLKGKDHGEFDVRLQKLIEKAAKGAMVDVDVAEPAELAEPAEQPSPKKKAKAAKKANLDVR
jgi:beta-lactamase regulating signal transducer with metallopeptidase domain